MTSLLDANALIALCWPRHEYHATMRYWFGKNARSGWATTALTPGRVRSHRVATGVLGPFDRHRRGCRTAAAKHATSDASVPAAGFRFCRCTGRLHRRAARPPPGHRCLPADAGDPSGRSPGDVRQRNRPVARQPGRTPTPLALAQLIAKSLPRLRQREAPPLVVTSPESRSGPRDPNRAPRSVGAGITV